MKQKSFKSFMGISAIALSIILIILTLVCFSVLTFVSADSEYKLSQKSALAVKQYYEADADANEALAKIFAIENRKNVQDILTKKGYNVTISENGDQITICVPISNKRELRVKAVWPFSSQVEIPEWEVIPTVKGDFEGK